MGTSCILDMTEDVISVELVVGSQEERKGKSASSLSAPPGRVFASI